MIDKLLSFLPARRWVNLLAAGVCAALMAYALYLQYYKFQEPCPLCMLQRVVIVFMGVIFFIAGIHHPGKRGATVYGVIIALIGLVGAAISARHVWIQYLPPEQVPQCGPGLSYMLETMPFGSAILQVLHGSGECADKSWMFLGLTIPGWTFLFFVALSVLALVLPRKR
ncbi:disulfide bond formation protein B [Leeia sp. TBRC 13508]|uniref:Disulfide bond formation protein B n=1 Tax=Leeia speluncae TaxID=2884804 RepID=A0ABS8D9A7_9NEIS|nr:disulfide bond formation protein B [Leeia speluncae]MCB6184794.1 disulfide bond formation protein B [Leeia speluncae]